MGALCLARTQIPESREEAGARRQPHCWHTSVGTGSLSHQLWEQGPSPNPGSRTPAEGPFWGLWLSSLLQGGPAWSMSAAVWGLLMTALLGF